MWMMGCTGGREFEAHDSFNGRKLRPLVPRHVPSVGSTSSAHSPSFSSIHGHDFLGQLHHFTNVNDDSRRHVNNSPQMVVSSRWNPTAEQLRALEELYRRGTRTPSAEQIQHITSQLRRYGKIEGKNVFYWFQNHKARERQKRRRQMESSSHPPPPTDIQILRGKDSGSSRTGFEDEQAKNRPHFTNCSELSEESISTQRAEKGTVFADCRTGGRMQLDEKELQQRKNLAERNSGWQIMQTSSSSCPLSLSKQLSKRTSLATAGKMDPNFIKTGDFNVFVAPQFRENGLKQMNLMSNEEHYCENSDKSETLELFPLCSDNSNNGGKEYEISASAINENLASHPFYEFLPLKN